MGTGISISSINRIKELAEEKKYAEALEVLDTQDLDKSINPQFLRISGEIFRENKRYYDSRKILLKAHQMSPQGLRIIAELIQLYLELGYFSKAQRYYDQYMFYTTPEDNQKEYVEYIMKKGIGADIKELASILIPILERLPEDRWNFESVLLYDKLDRKDKALDESRYILENFKDSVYVKPAIDYIEDKLDVDAYFYVYPRQEKEEDRELFGDLIEEEEKLLEADYLRMYPPEAKIMVEAEDKEGIDIKPAKEKKAKKKKKAVSDSKEEAAKKKKQKKKESAKDKTETTEVEKDDIPNEISSENEQSAQEADVATSAESGNSDMISEEQLKQEREAALEKLLSKRTSTELIKESAKQAVKAAKEIDTAKAKEQVKSVAKTVKGNVKKATDVLGEAVGVKAADIEQNAKEISNQNEIVDGIIESVLEPPKKSVGQVVTNEELDALIPESLEAMSAAEIAELEAKKAEEERLELEALEAQLKLEEEKKAKSRAKRAEPILDSDVVQNLMDTDNKMISVSGDEFIQLKERFLATVTEEEEEEPLESLGFIKVVQSDVDAKMEEEIPDAANILHQMIDNKEFYAGEDSTKFESKASYENHGFEIEDYSFETFEAMEDDKPTQEQLYDNLLGVDEDIPTVEVIYAQEDVIDFSEMIPADSLKEYEISEKTEVSDNIEEAGKQEIYITEQENEWMQSTEESENVWFQDTAEPSVAASDADVNESVASLNPSVEQNEVAEKIELPEEYGEVVEAESPEEYGEVKAEAESSKEYDEVLTEAESPEEHREVAAESPEEYDEVKAEAESLKEYDEVLTEAESPEEHSEVVAESPKEYDEVLTEAESLKEYDEVLTEAELPEEYDEVKAEAESPEEYGEMMAIADLEEDGMDVVSVEKTAEEKAALERENRRHLLRINILITEGMVKKLMDLKESR